MYLWIENYTERGSASWRTTSEIYQLASRSNLGAFYIPVKMTLGFIPQIRIVIPIKEPTLQRAIAKIKMKLAKN